VETRNTGIPSNHHKEMPMSKTLLLILLLLLTGCGPRWDIAREQVLSKIDSLLGEVDVKRQEATAAVAKLAMGVDELTHARVDVQVKFTRLSEDLTAAQEKLARTQEGHPRQRLVAEAESLRTTKDRLGRVLGLLQHREEQAKDRLQNLRLLLAGIDSKQVALKAIRNAAEVCDGIDFKSVEAEIKELEAAIDTELEFQEIRLGELEVDLD
jgi:peptidoglycan hydrolase CwlO-like protein